MLLSGCSDHKREQVLKVYNWSDYIGEDVIADFEQWYEEQTGEPIHVIYQTFDINETMLSKIDKGHEDYDVVCPSDYIIERMLNNDLLIPLDFSAIPDSINYIRNNRSPYIEDMFRKINPKIDANDYAVAYMWGTTGLIYNPKYISDEDVQSWNVIAADSLRNRVLMKDAPRDVYAPIIIYLRREQIERGEITMDELMAHPTYQDIQDVEDYLKGMKGNVAGWEADFGKEQMVKDRAWLSLNWSGDAVWAIEEAAEVGVELRYAVPSEGSTVWFDGWVIPKYAKNVSAATMFINFMCRPDIAIRNMDETGYVSANGDISVLASQIDEECDPIDVSYFFPGATEVCVDPAMYPDKSTIEVCALEHDWGEDTNKLLTMWSRVKSLPVPLSTYIVIIGTAVLAIAAAIASMVKKRRRLQSNLTRKK